MMKQGSDFKKKKAQQQSTGKSHLEEGSVWGTFMNLFLNMAIKTTIIQGTQTHLDFLSFVDTDNAYY